MLKKNPLQFSVVREDPQIELDLFRKFHFKKPVLIGSGGCTAFALASKYPKLQITLIEPNPAQIELIKTKAKALKKYRGAPLTKKFGVGPSSGNHSLIEQGNFESLFRGLRTFIFEFIAEKNEISKLLQKGTARQWKEIFQHPYWPVAFDLYFNNSILKAMFGAAAIQHAPAESYSNYFRWVFERGLLRKDRKDNYFLFHLLLGHYPHQKKAWPVFLQRPPDEIHLSTYQGMAQEFPNYSAFDFVGLSNIFDWSSEQEIRALASKLQRELTVGACILYRQLNNSKDFRSFFGPEFQWLQTDADRHQQKDRSLFYSSIHIARRTI